jgi:hypothetical protein
MVDQIPETLVGKTIRWEFDGGPTAGTVYEHRLNQDGSVEYRSVEGDGGWVRVQNCAADRVTGQVHVISYLSESGFALTAVLNFADMKVRAYASNETSWFPQIGRFSIIE